jgi:hypothetical protein
MTSKPNVLATLTLPDTIVKIFAQDYNVLLNPDDALYSPGDGLRSVSCLNLRNKIPALICH